MAISVHLILKICEVKLYLFEPVPVGDLKMAGKKVFPFLIILTEDLPSWWLDDHSPLPPPELVDGSLISLVVNFEGLRTK